MPQTLTLKLRTVLVALGLTLIVGAGLGYGGYRYQQQHLLATTNDYTSLSVLESKLRTKFDGSLDKAALLDDAKKGLVAAGNDPYTVYLTSKDASDLANDLNGTLSGIGAEVGIRGTQLTVIAPLSGTPAQKAGLLAGDAILKINDEDPTGLTLDEAVSKIRGAKGTQVTLKISRNGGAAQDITITREEISIPSVKWSLKNGNIGDIEVVRFGSDTGAKVKQAAQELLAQGATKFVLDLRNDPGGYLDQAVAVASQFVRTGLIVEERKGSVSIDKMNSAGGGLLYDKPLVVLINGGSASASEIVAGALQDHKIGQIIGEKSFGKGSVQEIVQLGGGAQLKVTVAHWYTPGGKNISKEGIKPDTTVTMTAEDVTAGRDPQLDKALELLK